MPERVRYCPLIQLFGQECMHPFPVLNLFISTHILQEAPWFRTLSVFYMEQAPKLVKEVGYVPLPAEAYILSYQRFLNKKTGSMFSQTSTVGADLVKLLKEGQ